MSQTNFNKSIPKDTQEGIAVSCYHCGQVCDNDLFHVGEKIFCCYGCKTVFEILNENDLCAYYDFESNPGIRSVNQSETYDYLNEPDIRKRLVLFEIEGLTRVQFYVPTIHCISCIWLLENLSKLNSGILKSEVNFPQKTVLIEFSSVKIKLSDVAALLSSTGYKPFISLEKEDKLIGANNGLLTKLAVAGFCFGNIMMLSFPEYLGIDASELQLKHLFSYLNIFLSLPVIFYSAKDYFISAWKSFSQRQVNIDVPIAIGISVLVIRSTTDILLQQGPGYLDSLAGLVFFLLIGRWFQNKTYEGMAFERDYKSYFPLAVYKKEGEAWKACAVNELEIGNELRIRNGEIIPADSLLLDAKGYIDYSFVTGESNPVKLKEGDLVYAGGKVVGQPVHIVVNKKISQSHLTSLWNNKIFAKDESKGYASLMDQVARIFTWSVLSLAVLTGVYWYYADPSRVWLIVTAVLMVACPCALALAAPFTYGSMLRVFGNRGLYLKNSHVIEEMAQINSIVFDKTGTITYGSNAISFSGELSGEELKLIKTLAVSSTHPLSILIANNINGPTHDIVQYLAEFPGKGIEGRINDVTLRFGSADFVAASQTESEAAARVYVSINNQLKGFFEVATRLRPGIQKLVGGLNGKVKALLSGDSAKDGKQMSAIFGSETKLAFLQSPQDKLDFIDDLQKNGSKVMMIGDGLNDSGALKQSNVGLAIADDTGVFTPSCDGILSGSQLEYLDRFMDLSKAALSILKVSLLISLLYNVLGLSFAVTGHLTPLVAAILMPISSISVVVFTTLMVSWMDKRKFS